MVRTAVVTTLQRQRTMHDTWATRNGTHSRRHMTEATSCEHTYCQQTGQWYTPLDMTCAWTTHMYSRTTHDMCRDAHYNVPVAIIFSTCHMHASVDLRHLSPTPQSDTSNTKLATAAHPHSSFASWGPHLPLPQPTHQQESGCQRRRDHTHVSHCATR